MAINNYTIMIYSRIYSRTVSYFHCVTTFVPLVFKFSCDHRRVLWKKEFLEIAQNSQENTCARVCANPTAWAFIKNETLALVFSC